MVREEEIRKKTASEAVGVFISTYFSPHSSLNNALSPTSSYRKFYFTENQGKRVLIDSLRELDMYLLELG